jgi:uncharacterized membrane protein
MVFVGVYDSVEEAQADYRLVHELHTEAGLIDGYDAAVVERRDDGQVKIVKKHETPTRVGGVLGGGVGLATGLVVALFPFAAVGGGLLVGTGAGGAILGAVAGHAAAGMSRHDLKELGEHLDAGTAGLVVVAVSDMGAKVEQAMKRAAKLEQKGVEGGHGRDRARRRLGHRRQGVARGLAPVPASLETCPTREADAEGARGSASRLWPARPSCSRSCFPRQLGRHGRGRRRARRVVQASGSRNEPR